MYVLKQFSPQIISFVSLIMYTLVSIPPTGVSQTVVKHVWFSDHQLIFSTSKKLIKVGGTHEGINL